MATLINAVFDFQHRKNFPRVKDYFAFYNFDQASRDKFNAALLRNLEKSHARKITSALVMRKEVAGILDKPQRLARALEILPLSEAQVKFDTLPPDTKEPPYFYALLDYNLNRVFLKLDDYLAAHYFRPDQEKQRRMIEIRLNAAIKEKLNPEQPVLHIFSDTLSDITSPDIDDDRAKKMLDRHIKAESLASFKKHEESVLRFYGFGTIYGNPVPENNDGFCLDPT